MLSAIIGFILVMATYLCVFIVTIILFSIPSSIKNKDISLSFIIIGFIVCTIIISITMFINIYVFKNYKVIHNEVPNIVSYEGIANIKEGKYNYDYLYFTQGINNNYTVLKIKPTDCQLHYVEDEKIKIIENHKEYLSEFRYLAMETFDDNIIRYDIYLPNKYKSK